MNIQFSPAAQRKLGRLPPEIQLRLATAIDGLSVNPRPSRVVKLQNRNAYRIRIGDYRVIYEIDDREQTVVILDMGHRSDIYR